MINWIQDIGNDRICCNPKCKCYRIQDIYSDRNNLAHRFCKQSISVFKESLRLLGTGLKFQKKNVSAKV